MRSAATTVLLMQKIFWNNRGASRFQEKEGAEQMIFSRRRMLKALLLACTSLAVPSLASSRQYGLGEGVPWEPMVGDMPHHGTRDERFLTMQERTTVAAISARLIPSEDDGPGATEADVVTFIDRQLARFYGRGQHWYMKGPFLKGAATQGYQSEHAPAQLYRMALVRA